MNIDWNFGLAIVTAMVAVLALIQSQYQIRINNKQHLFDKRLENYLVIAGLIQLYKHNLIYFKEKKDTIDHTNDLKFSWLTNNSYLEEITSVIEHPLEEPYHKNFLFKLENIKEVAAKSSFLYKGKSGQLFSGFALHYQELLFAMYQYQKLYNDMSKYAHEYNIGIEEVSEKFDEDRQRAKLQETIAYLNQSYDRLVKENIEEKIKKQIKL